MTEEEYSNYMAKASRLCARNEKCEQDLRKKLFQWGVSDTDGEKIIEELKKSGFINHQRYALSFTRDKLRFNHWGKKKIAFALRSKGIEEPYVREALDQIPEEQYTNILQEELRKKDLSLKTRDPMERKNKLSQFLLQKGFESGKVFELVDSRMRERNENE